MGDDLMNLSENEAELCLWLMHSRAECTFLEIEAQIKLESILVSENDFYITYNHRTLGLF